MSSAQKFIKILAIILAVFLIMSICSILLTGIGTFSGIMYSREHKESNTISRIVEEVENIETLRNDVKIKIELEATNLEIREGDRFQIEKRNISSHLNCRVVGNTLEIRERNRGWFQYHVNDDAKMVIYIPKNIVLSTLELSMGVGVADIQDVQTKKLDIDAGAGKMILSRITSEKTEIDGGAGNFTVNDSILKDLDLDCGVGVTKITGDIEGKSKISCGVGRTELNLTQSKDHYVIRTETGLGRITLNGERCYDEGHYGDGKNVIKINGGVGSVEITTK